MPGFHMFFFLCPLGPLTFLGVDLMDCFKDTERIQLGLISQPVLIFCVPFFVLWKCEDCDHIWWIRQKCLWKKQGANTFPILEVRPWRAPRDLSFQDTMLNVKEPFPFICIYCRSRAVFGTKRVKTGFVIGNILPTQKFPLGPCCCFRMIQMWLLFFATEGRCH